jgi:hypothetical protein
MTEKKRSSNMYMFADSDLDRAQDAFDAMPPEAHDYVVRAMMHNAEMGSASRRIHWPIGDRSRSALEAMTLSDKEQTFLVRVLDKATTPHEADTYAKNCTDAGIDGYRLSNNVAPLLFRARNRDGGWDSMATEGASLTAPFETPSL